MAGFHPVDPKQSFPALEEKILERWRERDVFARSLANRESSPLWGFYEGPPTANGKPGSHHVLARVFKDIYPRFRTMTGHRVPRKAGWDCHGLPVELEVEGELGITSKEEIEAFGIAEFNERCRESVFRYVEDWNRLTERIGFWIDLDDPYVTMTNEYIESVWWALRRIWDDGRLYEDYKVVPYCPRDGTALSSHEVALGYHDVEDPAVYVKLPVRDPGESPLEPGDELLVWTTTPWTLITNAAVAAGSEIEYVRAQLLSGDEKVGAAAGDEVFVLARDRVEQVLGEDVEILASFPGEQLADVPYEPPFDYITDYGPRGHTILLADFVTTDEGTGLVHTAIAFGEDDFRLGEQYGITLQNPVDLRGRFDERITDFAGQWVKAADPAIVEALEQKGKLLRAESYLHAYPHCWRCDTPLIYYAKASWYVKTTEVRDRMLAANEEIGWHPEHIKHGRFGKWLEGNVDWALSRDRYWGTPLPIWECDADDCEERFCAGSIAEIKERAGDIPDDLHRPYIDEVTWSCERDGCDGTLRRVSSVIDTWFDSGSMPWAQFHYPFENEELFDQRFPADFICEAIDQTRGWFYTLLAEAVLLFDNSSYRNVVCLGLILDPEGQKMSKSRGNVVEPWDVIERHGADAFRWYYLASQQPWSGYRFSVDTVGEAVRHFLLTLWNTYSFWVTYANASGLEPGELPYVPKWDGPRRRRGHRARPLGGIAAAAHDRRGPRADERLRLHGCRARDRRLHGGALQLVRAAQPAAILGRGLRGARDAALLPRRDRQAARPLHAVHRRGDLREPSLRPGDRPGETRRRMDQSRARLGTPLRLSYRRRGLDRCGARDGHGGRSANRRARPRRPRPGEGQAPPASSQGGRGRLGCRALGDRRLAESSPRSSTSRSSTSCRARRSWSPIASSRTTARSGRASARACPRPPRRSRRSRRRGRRCARGREPRWASRSTGRSTP